MYRIIINKNVSFIFETSIFFKNNKSCYYNINAATFCFVRYTLSALSNGFTFISQLALKTASRPYVHCNSSLCKIQIILKMNNKL